MGPTHVRFGAACAAVCLPAPLLAIPLAAVCAILPDLDQKQSTASKWLPPLGWFVRLWAGGHRRRTHLRCATGRNKGRFSVACATVFALLVAGLVAVNVAVAWGFAIGYLSHLLGDWIFDGNRRWGPNTDGKTERMIKPLLLVVVVIALAVRVLQLL